MKDSRRPRPLALIDVLGFRDLVSRQPLEAVVKQYLFTQVMRCARDWIVPESAPQSMVFSDTILLFPGPGAEPALSLERMVIDLCVLISNCIVGSTHGMAFPIRAGVAVGEFVATQEFRFPVRESDGLGSEVLREIMFPMVAGKAVVDAYEWERKQKWVGASLSPSSVESLRKPLDPAAAQVLDKLVARNDLIEWDVPTSHGLIKTFAVNFLDKRYGNSIIEILENTIAKCADLSIKAKYLASARFARHVAEKGLYNSTSP